MTTTAGARVGTTVRTVAEQFHDSPVVNESIDRIVQEMVNRRASIDRVRGPLNEEYTSRYRELLRQACEVRGRDKLFFDYIGSGLGNGAFVELADGSVKLDLIEGIGVNFFGHNDPEATAVALRAATGDTIMQGNLQANHDSTEFAQLLIEAASKESRLAHAFLTNSGAMANESALKICYQKNMPANRMLVFANSFMGRSTTMAQLGDSAAYRVGVPEIVQVDYMPFYDPQEGQASIEYAVRRLEEYIERYPGKHAAFTFELVQGEGGFNPAPREFFVALMEICKANGIAVWIDEVQTFGRTGRMFAFETMGVGEFVDVCTVGKMTQACACLFTKEYNPKPGLLSGTFIGSTVALNVGAHYLRRLRDGDYFGPNGRIERHRRRFVEGVKAIQARHPEWFGPIQNRYGEEQTAMDVAGGLGGMMRFTPFGGRKDAVMKTVYALYDEGVMSFYCGHGPYHVRFLPPLGVMPLELWDTVFDIVERALSKVAPQVGGR